MYSPSYDNAGIRSATYDVLDHVSRFFEVPHEIAVDIGCGTCRKIIPLASRVGHYYGVDIEKSMLERARENIEASGASNLTVHHGTNVFLPFETGTVDLVSSFLSPWNIFEVGRVLRDGGRFVVETIGGNDKRELKSAFGSDRLGWRGILLSQSPEDRMANLLDSFVGFVDVEVEVHNFETRVSRESLELLLSMTPTVRDFSPSDDRHTIDSLCDDQGFVTFQEERVLISGIRSKRPLPA